MARDKNELGQYFTEGHIANLMVSMISKDSNAKILEPSSGEGIFLNTLHKHGYSDCQAVEIDTTLAKNQFYPVSNESFLSWYSEERFDVIIGNPPYIRWKDLDETLKSELKTLDGWGDLFNPLSDYLLPFIHKSIEMLKDSGELIFITPSFWMHTQHSLKLRKWMLTKGNITEIVFFDEARVFKGVASSIIIFKFVKNRTRDKSISFYRYQGTSKIPTQDLFLENPNLFEHSLIPNFHTDKTWTFATTVIQTELDNFEQTCTRDQKYELDILKKYEKLGEYVKIANGMVSGLDKAFQIDDSLAQELNVYEKQSTLKVAKANMLKEIWSDEYMLYIDIPKGLSEEEVLERYPNFYYHLSNFRDKLEARYSYDRAIPFWEWVFRRSEKFLTDGNPKAFVPSKERLTSRPRVRFCLVPNDHIATQDVTAFGTLPGVKESIEYIVAFLSLPEITHWVKFRGLMKGGVAEFSEKPLSNIPFRSIDWESTHEVSIHDQIAELVNSMKTDSEGDKRVQMIKVEELFHKLFAKKTHDNAERK